MSVTCQGCTVVVQGVMWGIYGSRRSKRRFICESHTARYLSEAARL